MDREAEMEKLATELVERATAGHAKLLSPAALKRLREHLIDELLCTSYGRDKLRNVMDAPVVHESGTLGADGEAPADDRKKGEGA